MITVYRIVKDAKRAKDLCGAGSFKTAGRWHNYGVYMLYTSENRSLAFLENLVYLDSKNMPPDLYIMALELSDDPKNIYILPPNKYPENWMDEQSLECRALGTSLMSENKYLAIKVRSKVNPYEYNYLLNPLFPRYHDLVKIISVEKLNIDTRLI